MLLAKHSLVWGTPDWRLWIASTPQFACSTNPRDWVLWLPGQSKIISFTILFENSLPLSDSNIWGGGGGGEPKVQKISTTLYATFSAVFVDKALGISNLVRWSWYKFIFTIWLTLHVNQVNLAVRIHIIWHHRFNNQQLPHLGLFQVACLT